MSKKITASEFTEWLVEDGRGIELTGEYSGTKIKTEFSCKNDHRWITKPKTIRGGSGCPHCAGVAPLGAEIVSSRFEQLGIMPIGQYVNVKTKMSFSGKCGHVWETTPNRIFAGTGCPYCAGAGAKMTNKIFNDRVKDLDNGIRMTGEYLGSFIKSKFECSFGHSWEALPSNILQGIGCPSCHPGGFNPRKPGWEYVLDFGHFIKFGITNNLRGRLNQHKRNGAYTVAHTRRHEDGLMALEWEKNIKKIYGGRFVTKDECPDGWTETLPKSLLESIL
jgi:hypothetical protein